MWRPPCCCNREVDNRHPHSFRREPRHPTDTRPAGNPERGSSRISFQNGRSGLGLQENCAPPALPNPDAPDLSKARLVDHQHLHPGEGQVRLQDVVHQPARCGDDDVRVVGQVLKLCLHGLPADQQTTPRESQSVSGGGNTARRSTLNSRARSTSNRMTTQPIHMFTWSPLA